MPRILIIDDKPGVRQLFVEELACRGFTMGGTGDEKRACEIIHSFKPDLVLLDPYMKNEHRWDLLQEIRGQNPHLPLLIVSAYDTYNSDPRAVLADGILIKSFYFDELIHRIAGLLEQKVPPSSGKNPESSQSRHPG